MRTTQRVWGLVLGLVAAGWLTGCGDAHAVEDRALVIAVGVGPGTTAGEESWTFVVPNISITASSISSLPPGDQVYSITVQAPSWAIALVAVQDRMSRDLFLGDLAVVAFDTRMPVDQVAMVMRSLDQDGLIPKSFWVIGAQGPVKRLLTWPTPQEVIPRYYLAAYFACRTCHAVDWNTLGWEWWVRRLTPGVTPVAPVMTETRSGLRVQTLAVYPPGRLPVTMPPEIANGFACLTGRLMKGVLTGNWRGVHFAIERMRAASSASVRWEKSGVRAAVGVDITGYLATSRLPGANQPWLRGAQQWAARRIAAECLAAVAWANAHRTDPFGYTRDAILTVPDLAQRLAPGTVLWRPLTVSVNVDVRLQSRGTVA